MHIIVDDNNCMETHRLPIQALRAGFVPVMNALPTFVIQKMLRLSADAAAVSAQPGSTHALEVMYTRYHRNMFVNGVFKGVLDHFWHGLFSQPKALRNRLKIVERLLEEEMLRKIQGNLRDISILTVGGGSSRAGIHCIDRLRSQGFDTHGIKVKNVDKSQKAINLCKDNAEKAGILENFEWILADAREVKNLISGDSIDMVEMVGLLDYFSEEKGIEVIKQIYGTMKDGALFIVANVHPNREQRFVRKTGWPDMYYREPKDLDRMLKSAGFTSEPTIIFEPLKVHIVAVVRK